MQWRKHGSQVFRSGRTKIPVYFMFLGVRVSNTCDWCRHVGGIPHAALERIGL